MTMHEWRGVAAAQWATLTPTQRGRLLNGGSRGAAGARLRQAGLIDPVGNFTGWGEFVVAVAAGTLDVREWALNAAGDLICIRPVRRNTFSPRSNEHQRVDHAIAT